MIEGSFHGHDFLELIFYGEYVLGFEHFAVYCRLESVGGVDVPCAEYDVVQVGQGNYLVVFEVFLVGAFAYAHHVVLRHRPYGLCETFAGHQYACYECA